MKIFAATRTIVIMLIVAIALGLSVWYFYLNSQKENIQSMAKARNFTGDTPTFFGSLGSTDAHVSNARTDNTTAQEGSPGGKPPRLWEIASAAVAGSVFSQEGSTTMVYFVDRATGHILSANLVTGEKRRITNTLVPHTTRAIFVSTSTVALMDIDENATLRSRMGQVINTASSTEGTLRLIDLPRETRALAASPDGKTLFYLEALGGGGVAGIIASPNGGSPRKIFSSALSDWMVSWPGQNRIVLTQKAASGVTGSSYQLTPKGQLSVIIEDVPGLNVKAASSSAFLYSSYSPPALDLFAVSAPDTVPSGIHVSTLAEKCVWAGGGTAYCAVPQSVLHPYMNEWYRGEVHTSDSIWRVYTAVGTVESVVHLEDEAGIAIDVQDLSVSKNGAYLSFVNNRTGSFFVYRIAP